MPNIKPLLERAKENATKWQQYVETDEDKQIYTKFRIFNESEGQSD